MSSALDIFPWLCIFNSSIFGEAKIISPLELMMIDSQLSEFRDLIKS
ncbi:MAG: hypothetical protein ACKO3J_05060 [Candidatus Nanopelagicus sp.]